MRTPKALLVLIAAMVLFQLKSVPLLDAEESPKYGGILRVAISEEPHSLDMHQEQFFTTLPLLAPCYNTLLQFNAHGTPEIVGDLADSWIMSSDNLTYTFSLRRGVTFQDGSLLAAEDVKASWDKIIFPPSGIISPRRNQYAIIKSIDTPDPFTVVFHLHYHSPFFLELLAHPANAIYAKKYLDKDIHYYERYVMGTGPFTLKKWIHGVSIELARRDNYWRSGLPYLDGVKYLVFTSGWLQASAISAGEIDMVLGRTSPTRKILGIEEKFGQTYFATKAIKRPAIDAFWKIYETETDIQEYSPNLHNYDPSRVLAGKRLEEVSLQRNEQGKPFQLVWNMWAEDQEGPWFQPVRNLKPKTRYRIILDLSWFKYADEHTIVQSWNGDPKLHGTALRWLSDLPRKKETLQAFLLTDDMTYFEYPEERNAILQVNLQKIRDFSAKGAAEAPEQTFNILAKDEDPDFRFGHAIFEVETTDREGLGAIGVILLSNRRLVDKITARFCIGNCAEKQQVTSSPRKPNSLAVIAEDSPAPDASLYFLELAPEHIYGVFHRNDLQGDNTSMKNAKVWSLAKSPQELIQHLRTNLIPALGQATTDQALVEYGKALFETLFPSQIVPAAADAQKAFESFVKAHVSQPEQLVPAKPPSIFAQVVTHLPDAPPIIPLGLMVVETANGQMDFLGFHFRIEAPMEIQTYKSRPECLTRWVTVLPPESLGADLGKATARMGNIYSEWQSNSSEPPFESMLKFTRWIGVKDQEDPPTALVILSHHTYNALSYTDDDKLLSASVQRQFSTPSMAILNGCGTGGLGAAELIRYLNSSGIETAIATSTEIDPNMAADFFRCLNSQLTKNEGHPDYTVEQVYFDTLECLRNPNSEELLGEEYGAKVLRYTLLGNGNTRLCAPTRRSQ